VPDPSPPRRRFRLLRWSLFGLALVGLGFVLYARLPPRPRCSITFSSPVTIELFSRNGDTLVTLPAQTNNWGIPVQGTKLFQVWDTNSVNELGTHLLDENHWNHVWIHAFSPSQRYLAAWQGFPFSNQGLFHLVDFRRHTHKEIPLKRITDGHIIFSPLEQFVLFHSGQENSHLVHIATGEVVHSFEARRFHGFGPDDSMLFYDTGWDIHVWNIPLRKLVDTLPEAREVALSPDRRFLAARVPESWVFLDLKTFAKRRFHPELASPLQTIFSPDGQTLAIVYQTGHLEFWDVAAGKRRGKVFHPGFRTFSAGLFSPDSQLFCLTLANPNAVTVWDVASATMLWSNRMPVFDERIGPTGPTQTPLKPGFTPDSRFLLTYLAGDFHCLHVVEPRTGKTVHLLYSDETCLFPNNLRFTTTRAMIQRQPHFLEKMLGNWWPGHGNAPLCQVRVFGVAGGTELARLESDTMIGEQLSEDGRTLVTQHREKDQYVLRIWDIPLRPPLLLVIGIPLGVGLSVFLFSRYRARRKVRTKAIEP
jgi:hypothetical protein